MYNITDTDVEFKKILSSKVKDFEKDFDKNMFTQEATLEMIHMAVSHSKFNNFKNNRNIWNAAGYVNIISYDLKIAAKHLMLSTKEWEKRYFARQASLLIYEASTDLFNLLGKGFRNIISDLSELDLLKDELKQITKELNTYNNVNQDRLKLIRNISIAHRDKDTIEQLDLIHSISW